MNKTHIKEQTNKNTKNKQKLLKRRHFYSVLTEMLDDVVPMPRLAWRCEFSSLKVKEEELVREVFTTVVAHLANIRGRKTKMAHKKDGVDPRWINLFRNNLLSNSKP